MPPRTSLIAVGLAATFGLAGCVSPSPAAPIAESFTPSTEETTPSETSPSSALGDQIVRSGYSFYAPEGWATPPDAPSQADVFLVSDVPDTTGFINTLNVILGLGPKDAASTEEIERVGAAQLEASGATNVLLQPRSIIAGFESAHFSAEFTRSGVTYTIEQYYPTNAGQTYVTTFSFGKTVSQADREALAELVLATWEWA